MDETSTNPEEDLAGGDPETPEDVAVLYTWANVHGGKYRDFSASRREFRAQQRHRMVEAQRQAELEAAQAREEAARRNLEEARRAEEEARHDDARFAEAEEARMRAEKIAEEERLAAQRHVETAEELKLAMEQAQREMEEARARAEEQANRWREADARWRALNQDREFVPGEIDDPYYFAGPLEPTAFAPGKGVRSSMPQRVSSERRIAENYYRSRDESRSSQEVARRNSTSGVSSENALVGMFSSGRRNTSAGRPAYRERMVEPRIETPEDTRERQRSDERYRLTSTHRAAEDYDTVGHYGEDSPYGGEAQYDDNPNDSYYDRMPNSHGSDSTEGRNTAPRGLHIPPRAQALRSNMESSASRAAAVSAQREIVRSEDPQPGNAHVLDKHAGDRPSRDTHNPDTHGHDTGTQEASRSRRRESAEDVSARTARRPRSYAEPQRQTEGFGERARRIAGSSGEMAAYQPGENREAPAQSEDVRRSERAAERAPLPREQRPEWLVRNAPLPGDARYGDAARSEAEAAAGSSRDQAREAAHEAEGRYALRPMGDTTRDARPADPRSLTSRRGDRPPDPVLERIQERIQERVQGRTQERGTTEREVASERTREVPAANEQRQRESQTVRASDGGFNLRPLPDRPLGGNLPPLRDRPASSSDLRPMRDRPEPRESQLRPLADAPRATQQPAAEAAPSRYADATEDRRRYARAESSRGDDARNDVTRIVDTARADAARAAADTARLDAERARYSYDSGDDRPAYLTTPIPPPQPRQAATPSVAPASEGRPARTDYRVEARNEARADARGEAARVAARDSRPDAASRPVPPSTPASGSRGASTVPVDTLQQSRERVAARWFALKGLMGPGAESSAETPAAPVRSREMPAPMLSVVSLSGGVGKTSLVATLGRSLSSVGEKILLADSTAHGLLPYYFGARELRPDVVRTFSPPPGSSDAPVYMVNYETDRLQGDEAGQKQLVEEIARHARGTQRVLLDISGSSAWLARLLARQNSAILVPIAPDMNSVLSIQNVERYFSGAVDNDSRPVQPYYVLNQFDASLPLHLDVREVLRQQLGDRLLPVMIRRSPSVAEALAEGMTVIDYAPEAPVTEDYIHLAEWVRKLAAPAVTGLRSIRWSER